ncbi:FtsW/RodA/SpoVE family cell cycle protein [Candidatus Kryptobacter tengchongensis]|uniref:FtsW/RodA/SpoVE family cell cycle protein n=1 Tax=Kryptobacter tengchongensis TaxID=1643429 RepID=UPI000707DD07|nr:putative peptidoglycan glycosyltransferase FtsW [Candidatus Kryptobacter tengchongensis]CUS87690.1 cell division protein FtsW [Candidatus Kryptobacter tengchongensis]
MKKSEQQHIDRILFLLVTTLMFIGLLVVFSSTLYIASSRYNSVSYFLEKHFLRVLLGFVVMVLFAVFVDYRKIREYALYIFITVLILLILVLIFGKGNATRWLSIGPINFQVSEFAKIGMMIYLAYLIEKNRGRITDFKFGFFPLFFVVALVSGLVLLQKSFTMSFLIFVSGIILIFLAGVKVKHLAIMLSISFPVIVLFFIIEPYRLQRLLAYIDPGGALGRVRYQALQALIGLGTGGLFGVGPGHSRQREFYLPLAYDDYIFSIFGEEYGFIGSLFLIFIFFAFFYRGIRIAKYAIDDFGKFLSAGITFLIFLTALVHIGVVSGLLPPTGIPLPFISYGGSAMISNCIGVGILLNISKQIKH